MKIILRLLMSAVTLLVATQLVSGFEVKNFYIAIIAALVLGILNAVVRPVLILLTLPVNIMSLGLFTFVINAGLIWFMSTFVKGVEVDGFLPALFVALLLWLVGTLTNFFLRTEVKGG